MIHYNYYLIYKKTVHCLAFGQIFWILIYVVMYLEQVVTISLALKLGKPLLVEGAPGVGKTEVGKVLSRVLQTELIRLQCYEGAGSLKRSIFYLALDTFRRGYKKLIAPDAVLIIVSDTRTVFWEQAAGLLGEMARKVRDVIWLNPVPEPGWPGLPAAAAFLSPRRNFLAKNPRIKKDSVIILLNLTKQLSGHNTGQRGAPGARG